jgi:excisionase family DNA binding protein
MPKIKTATPVKPGEFITTQEAVQITRTSIPTIFRWIAEKRLTRYKAGGRTLLRASEVAGLIVAIEK